MKINKSILLLSSVFVMAACDLDKYPEGSTMTQDQKDEVISMIPERIESELNGLKSGLNVLGTLGNPNSTGYHFDYGFPAICMIYDQAGQDMTCKNDAIGYNKYISQQKFRDRITTSVFNEFIWKNYYNHLKTANDCIATLSAAFPEDKRTAKVKNYFGQALASRAFDYLQLIQTYQFTYIGHESAKGVPLVLDTMTDDEKLNNPRATVEQVYTQIMSDLNTAISYLAENPVTRKDKAQITAEVAYGLRARTNLLMGNWAAAASDAAKACAGARPYSIEEVSVPRFYDASDASWIWGIVITSEDGVVKTGIVNWASHLCSLTGMGYTTAASATDVSFRAINNKLWAEISASDVRKAWWVDDQLHSDALVNAYGAQNAYGWANGLFGSTIFSPYVNVKFGPEGGQIANSDNAQDWPLMRVEEMLLIEAEATGRDNLAAGKQKLEAFVKGYRDATYICNATNLDEFIDEIWFQRRIELWGEGFSLFDVLRLKKPIKRIGTNFPAGSTFADIAAESPLLIYTHIECETAVNKAITPADNNEAAIPPTPVQN